MASYHLSVKILSRSSGRSAVAAAAYRSRAEIKDNRQGLSFDYSNKKDLGHSEIMAPEKSPAWVYERKDLWNRVEAGEKRKDAQLMREVEVALPRELNDKEQIELLQNYCKQNFVKYGMIADINVHKDENNPHAHIMLTMRRIEGEGYGKKERSWNKKENVFKWREEWANLQNIYLAKAGFDIRVDHRNYAEQGLDVEPQIKRGITLYDSDVELERSEEYKRIAFENGQRIINNPEIALDHMTRYQSTFTHDDLLKYIHSHCDDSQFYAAVQAVTTSPEILLIHENEYDRFNKYTTRSLLETENKMFAGAATLSDTNTHFVKEKYVNQAAHNCRLSAEQKAVLEQTVNGQDIHAIIGHAGTGKSYTLNAVREAYEGQGYHLQGVSLSGVAAEGLENSSGIKSTTIHRKLFDWENDRSRLGKKSVLVIDEAGMVGTRQMQQMIATAKNAGSKIVIVGDTKQTQAVEAGGAFRGIIEQVGSSRLSEVWRQKDEWQKEATRLLSGNRDDISNAMDAFKRHGNIFSTDDYNQAANKMLREYVMQYSKDKTSTMISHTNADVERLNLVCRDSLKKRRGILNEKEVKIQTSTGNKYFAAGERVLFLRNEKSIGVKNGTFGNIAQIDKHGKMVVSLDDNRTVAVDTDQYNHITYGYAATVHKLQGATIDNSFVLASEGFDRHLGYVALSRHREFMRLYYSRDKFQNYEDLKRKFSNSGEKELLVDYKVEPDELKGILRTLDGNYATFSESEYMAAVERISDELRPEFMGQVKTVGTDQKGRDRFSTIDMIQTEQSLFAASKKMGACNVHGVDDKEIDDFISLRDLDKSQAFVIRRVANGKDLSIINYQTGTDRTKVASMIGEIYRDKGYLVEAVALSGMGAYSFEKESGIASKTIYKELWEWENGRNRLSDKSVLMIDNANMVGTRKLHQMISHAEDAGAKVVMFGNSHSLQSIEAGGAFRGILQNTDVARCSLMRPDDKTVAREHHWQDLLAGDEKDAALAVDMYTEHGFIEKSDDPAGSVVNDWLSHVSPSNFLKDAEGTQGKKRQILFHGTDKSFDSFGRTVDIGYHFGTYDQAESRLAGKPKDENIRIIKARVDIKNPLRVNDTKWHDRDAFKEMVSASIRDLMHADYKHFDEWEQKWLPGTDTEKVEARLENLHRLDEKLDEIYHEDLNYEQYYKQCRSALKNHGFDGMVYKNRIEGTVDRHKDSYVVFDAHQIKQLGGQYPYRDGSYKNNMMMAYRNDDVTDLNLRARKALIKQGYIDSAHETKIKTQDYGELAMAGGDRIMFLRKDAEMGINSGTRGMVKSVNGADLTVKIDEGETVTVNTRLYNDLNYGYAATVYRSAGMKVENTYILGSKHFNKHIARAALSAHSKNVKMYHDFGDHYKLRYTMGRAGDKDLAADYPLDAKAYLVTVKLRKNSRPRHKYILVEPQMNKEAEKKQLRRDALKYAYQQAGGRMKPAERKNIEIKAERVPIERYLQQVEEKSMFLGRDRGATISR